MEELLHIKDLTTRFYTDDGVVFAVNGVSYSLEEGEILGVVGESGCGKSVHALSIMGLIPSPPGKIEKGEVVFSGRDLLKASTNELRDIRGSQIAMVFQDPMTSLNPVFTVGFQITEALSIHKGMNNEEAREVAGDLCYLGIGKPLTPSLSLRERVDKLLDRWSRLLNVSRCFRAIDLPDTCEVCWRSGSDREYLRPKPSSVTLANL